MEPASESIEVPSACLSVVVPCRDSEASIQALLERVLAQPCVGELIVVDDGSKDRSTELVGACTDPRVRLLRQPRSSGEGAAVRWGVAVATRPYVIVQDVDLGGDPVAYQLLLTPLVRGEADVVYGPRLRATAPPLAPSVRESLTAGLLTLASKAGTRVDATALGPCLKAFRRELLDELVIEEDGPGFEAELAARVAAKGWRAVEAGVPSSARAQGEPEDVGWRDSLRTLYGVVRYGVAERLLDDAAARDARPASFAESDASLQSVLTVLDGAHRYADWVVSRLAPHLRGEILEIGAGHGTMTERLARYGHVTANDMSEQALRVLRQRFAGSSQVRVTGSDEELVGQHFDAIVLVNVLEHIEDDVGMLRHTAERLKPTGAVLVLAPALPALTSSFDRAIGHHRRYGRGGLLRTAYRAGLEVSSIEFLNSVGVLGWWLVAKRLGRAPTAPLSVRAYDALVVPWLRRVEERFPPALGQSLVMVARRPADGESARRIGERT